MNKVLRLLLVEDSELDAGLLANEIKRAGYDLKSVRVDTRNDFLLALESQEWDLILCDYYLLDFNAMTAIELFGKRGLDIPFIVVSARIGEETAVETMKAGADDYVMKGNLKRLVPAIERELREAKERQKRKKLEWEMMMLAQAIKSVSECVSITDQEDNILFVNYAFLTTYGYEQNELAGKHISIVRPETDLVGTVKEILPSTRRGGWEGELVNRRKDGSMFPIRLSTSPIKDEDGRIIALIGVAEDITGRKRAEDELRQSKEFAANIISSSMDMIVAVDKERRITEFNKAAEESFGYKREEVLGKQVNLLYADPAEGTKIHTKTLQEEQCVHEVLNKRKSGESFTAMLSASVLRDLHGEPVGVMGISRDISEHKRTEESLRESEIKFRTLADKSPNMIFINKKGRVVYANAQCEKIMDYTAEEFYSPDFNFLKLIAPECVQMVKDIFDRHLRDEEVGPYEYGLVTKHEGRIEAIVNTSLIQLQGDNAILGIVTDITERKNAEREILRMNRLYDVLSRINEMIVRVQDPQQLFDEACRIAVVNGSFKMAWIGIVDRETHFIKPVAKYGSVGNYLDGIRISIEDIPEGRGPTGTALREDRHFICRDIEHEPYMAPWRAVALEMGYRSSAAFPLRSGGGLKGVFTVYSPEIGWFTDEEVRLLDELTSDISYALESMEREHLRKGAEEKLRLSDQIIKQVNSLIIIADAKGQVTYISPSVKSILGYDTAEVLGDGWWLLTRDDLQERTEARDRVVLTARREEPMAEGPYETKLKSKNGETHWILWQDARGINEELIGVGQDITERKRAEEALQESEFWIKESQRVARLGSYVLDFKSGSWTSSQVLDEIFGIDKDYERSVEGWSKLVHPDQREEMIEYFSNVVTQGAPFDKDYRIVRASDGQERWVSGQGELVYDLKGGLLKMVGTIQDVTGSKLAETALRKSEEKYRRLFEESKDVVYISSPDGKFLDINPAGVELFGYSHKDELLQSVFIPEMFLDPHQRDLFQRQIDQQGFVKDFELKLKRKDGRILTLLETSTQVRDERAKTVMYRGILRDVTAQRDLEERFIQAQKMESIGTLAAGIAHDFNNILGIILAHSSMLRQSVPSEEFLMKSLDTINKSVQRGAGVVRQMLTFARKTDAVLGPIEANIIVKELSKLFEETFPKNITFMLDLGKNIPPIDADLTQFHQAIMNICINARDAMPNGGTLTIKTREVPGESIRSLFPDSTAEQYLHLSITDTGTGMDDTTKARIFDPFFTTKEKGKGTGLGLAVAYGVVKSHHGLINVETIVNQGSTFHLYFPISVHTEPLPDMNKSPSNETRGGNETILLVEDEEMLLDMAKSLLKRKGYRVVSAKDGQEAIQAYKRYQSDIALVLLDLGLPKVSGVEVFAKLKELNPKIRVIIASGYLEPDVKLEIVKAGAKDFVQKPYESNEILRKIRDILDKKSSSHTP